MHKQFNASVLIICIIVLLTIFLSPLALGVYPANASASVSVTSAYWQVGGSTVTTAKVGDTVIAKAVITAQGGSVNGTWKIEVVKDISWSSDQVMAQASGSVSLGSGASQTVSVSWSPDEASGQNSVDGYFIVVYYNSTKIYTMSSRLTVTTATAPTPTRTSTPTTTPKPTATVTKGSASAIAYWHVGSSNVTTAKVGDPVLAKAVITAQGGAINGTWTLEVIKDISLAPDEVVTQNSGSISLSAGGSQTLSLSWSPDTASGEDSVDGYFIVVYFNSAKIYTMTSYPPRLTVTTASVNVTSAYWQVVSSNVTTAKVGDTVLAKAIITANGGSINGTWTLQVIKDISLASDEIVAQSSGNVSLAAGGSQTISLSWSPDTAGGDNGVDGYFIVVYFNGEKIYTMTSYPPRLTVTKGLASAIGYWQIGSSNVTTAKVGDKILAKAILKAQGGSITGTWTLQVIEDISLASDEVVAQSSGNVSLAAGGSQTLSLSWSPNTASGDNGVDGYFIVVYFNGEKIYIMTSYPPRLTVTTVATTTHIATPMPNDEWRQNIRSGDILFDPTSIGGLGHVGICYGTDYVVEAEFNGVSKDKIETWDTRYGVYVLRVNCSDEVAAVAASLALTQVGKPYDFFWIQKSSDMNSSYWYCSELVWAVYMNQGIDIEYTPDIFAVSPWEIYKTTDVIAHYGPNIVAPSQQIWWAPQWAKMILSIIAECPVDLVVTDPDGLTVSRSSDEIPGALYVIDDFNDDGSPDTWVSIAESKVGTYNTTVVPQAVAKPTDTYTLKTYQETGVTVLADNVTIADIPNTPYVVEYSGEASNSIGWPLIGGIIGAGVVIVVVGTVAILYLRKRKSALSK
jgi:hypothetical protein